jgi:hypothetical protein
LRDIVGAAPESLVHASIVTKSRRMSRDDDNSFRVRPGRARARDGKTARRPLSFMQEVKRAVAKQGGDPRRLFRQ